MTEFESRLTSIFVRLYGATTEAPEAQYFWIEIQKLKKLAQKELLEDFARRHVDLLKKDLDE